MTLAARRPKTSKLAGLLAVTLVALFLAACGQKRDLYLPDAKSKLKLAKPVSSSIARSASSAS